MTKLLHLIFCIDNRAVVFIRQKFQSQLPRTESSTPFSHSRMNTDIHIFIVHHKFPFLKNQKRIKTSVFPICISKNTLERPQLVRNGAEKNPLEEPLMTVCVDRYENFMFNSPTDEQILLCINFLLNGDEQIIPGLSSGNRNEIHSICILSVIYASIGVLLEALCEFLWTCTHWECAGDQRALRSYANTWPRSSFLFLFFFSFSIYMILKKN